MTLTDIANLRLANQQISGGGFDAPKHLAAWMGAMQAQDYQAVKWAFGLRIPGSTVSTVEKVIDNGEIIRTHVLRPTWHFVSPDDLHWMLALSAPRIKPSLKYRQDYLGLTPLMLSDSNAIIAETVKGKHLGREEIAESLRSGGIELRNGEAGNNRLSHILLWAELSGIICSGRSAGNTQTYALISERISGEKKYLKEESLGRLAIKYFSSHGPATLKDFAWWSGLTSPEIKVALEKAGSRLENAEVNSVKYWFAKDRKPNEEVNSAWLLPAFDEFIIGYTDRSAVISLADHKKAVSQNGIFRPVIILNNQVAGLWKTTRSKNRIVIGLNLFKAAGKSQRNAIGVAAEAYSRFSEEKTEIKYSQL